MSKAVTRVVFTVNNYTGTQYENIKRFGIDSCKYLTMGKETGESGTPHLQGFLILKKKTRLSTITKALSAGGTAAYTAPASGSNSQAATYCQKDGVFFEHGTYPKGKGDRTDIKDFLDAVKRGADDEILADEHPACYAKYQRAKEALRTHVTKKRKLSALRDQYTNVSLRDWQKIALKKLMAQDSRKVTWVYDPVGNMGKSFLANYLLTVKGAYLVESGKRSDIAYAYNFEPIVVFDFTRSQEEQVNYSTIESFKNGRLFSPKYESGLKVFDSCKVLCLSNFNPDRSKLSADRWQVLEFPNWSPPSDQPPPRKKPRLERRQCEYGHPVNMCNCFNDSGLFFGD